MVNKSLMIDMMLPLFGATETNLFVVSGFNDGGWDQPLCRL